MNGFLKQKHSQLIIALFVLSAFVFLNWPEVDIYVSSLFFKDGFYLKHAWFVNLFYKSVGPVLIILLGGAIGFWIFNRVKGRNVLGINNLKMTYLILVLAVGSGLVVNLLFKEEFGRARPRDVVEFQGDKQFTPAFVISDQCERNCSFSSGHGSAAFFTMAFAFLFRNRRKLLALTFTYGCLVSSARIMAGGHFFSDNVISFFVMALTIDAFYYYFFIGKGANKKLIEGDGNHR